jgi:hypothetical protein
MENIKMIFNPVESILRFCEFYQKKWVFQKNQRLAHIFWKFQDLMGLPML